MTDFFYAIVYNGSGQLYGWQVILETVVIVVVTFFVIVFNILVIAVMMTTHGLQDVVGYYLVSLSVADLICGILITPLSVYPAIVQRWVYGDIVCKIESFVEIVLWSVTVYMFMWISVDRYLAVQKPSRYETASTVGRCKCWIAFSWLASIALSCPPLAAVSPANYYLEASVCVLDWSHMSAYSVTMAALVVTPSFITIGYTYVYIYVRITKYKWMTAEKKKECEWAPSSDPPYGNANHNLTCAITLAFVLSWLPWLLLQVYEKAAGPVDSPMVHFATMWLAIASACWKFVILVVMNSRFRKGLKHLCDGDR
ncbi:PREDICTED: probable G-protein coupled receptor 52 [Priapulus caudatus]|uniref:Probable G-protein coupled receptor 52 n=1 Tax=Priapulus caudatus TaxID=37621 RepID=A0ABM1EQA9_PRICU|nr:PREDICTED: probable G-protein coupled receptor 52 [Priapulus caudatus]